jgi:hypothetical protein
MFSPKPNRALDPARRRLIRALPTVLALAVVLGAGAPSSGVAATPAPAVSTGGISNLTYSSVDLHGHVDPRGQATNYFFQYGHTRKYGAQSPLAPVGGGTASVPVTQSIAGLQPLTVYHYRLVAISAGGATLGADRSFTTPKIPLSVAIVGVPNPVPFGNPFVVEGTLSGTGSANHLVKLEANPFPYLGGFQPVGNAELTSATGGFSFPFFGLLVDAQLRVVTVGKPLVSSPVIVEGVAVRVVAHVRRTKRRGFARIYGTVTPSEVGAQVGFQLLEPGHRSVNVGGTIATQGTAAVSRFGRVIHVHHGLYKVLVRVTDGSHASAYSSPVLIR